MVFIYLSPLSAKITTTLGFFLSFFPEKYFLTAENTEPDEPPTNKLYSFNNSWHIFVVDTSSTVKTSSILASFNMLGIMLEPMPGIYLFSGLPPNITDPTISTATIFAFGNTSLTFWDTPVMVPPELTPKNT